MDFKAGLSVMSLYFIRMIIKSLYPIVSGDSCVATDFLCDSRPSDRVVTKRLFIFDHVFYQTECKTPSYLRTLLVLERQLTNLIVKIPTLTGALAMQV